MLQGFTFGKIVILIKNLLQNLIRIKSNSVNEQMTYIQIDTWNWNQPKLDISQQAYRFVF
jgi:hypothetical protein